MAVDIIITLRSWAPARVKKSVRVVAVTVDMERLEVRVVPSTRCRVGEWVVWGMGRRIFRVCILARVVRAAGGAGITRVVAEAVAMAVVVVAGAGVLLPEWAAQVEQMVAAAGLAQMAPVLRAVPVLLQPVGRVVQMVVAVAVPMAAAVVEERGALRLLAQVSAAP